MSLTDGLTVLGVFGAIGYMIFAKLRSKDSPFLKKSQEWLKKTKGGKPIGLNSEESRQTYSEKRQIM